MKIAISRTVSCDGQEVRHEQTAEFEEYQLRSVVSEQGQDEILKERIEMLWSAMPKASSGSSARKDNEFGAGAFELYKKVCDERAELAQELSRLRPSAPLA